MVDQSPGLSPDKRRSKRASLIGLRIQYVRLLGLQRALFLTTPLTKILSLMHMAHQQDDGMISLHSPSPVRDTQRVNELSTGSPALDATLQPEETRLSVNSPVLHDGDHHDGLNIDSERDHTTESATFEPVLIRGSPSLSRHPGGRSTPGPNRYQYQPSSIDTSSYITEPDRQNALHWHEAHSFVAIDPFIPSVVHSLANFALSAPDTPQSQFHHFHSRPPTPMQPPHKSATSYELPSGTFVLILAFLFDTIPRQVYLHFLLRLPSLYFSRVARIFEDAELSMPDIKRMAVVTANQWKDHSPTAVNTNWNFEPSIVSPPFLNLKVSWESFIDSLMREWKTLNIVSVLLLSAILTTLQIEAAAADPITRSAALLALVCSLMSLLYGCMYIIRFGSMRKPHKASEWAEEAQKTKTVIWWNVWVLLATPAIWLSWSIIFYLTCIMSFVWRTGTSHDPVLILSPKAALGPRIAITCVFSLGVIYFSLIVSTFRRYGDAMDKAWQSKVLNWAENPSTVYDHAFSINRRTSTLASDRTAPPSHPTSLPIPHPYAHGRSRPHSHPPPPPAPMPMEPSPGISAPPAFSRPAPDLHTERVSFKTAKILDLRFKAHVGSEMPNVLLRRDILVEDWRRFIADASLAWDGQYPRLQREQHGHTQRIRVVGRSRPQDVIARFIQWWNDQFFIPRGALAVLCEERPTDYPASPLFALYLVDLRSPSSTDVGDGGGIPEPGARMAERFGSVPEGLERVDVYDPVPTSDQRGHGGDGSRMGKTLIFADGPHTARVHWRNGGAFVVDERAVDTTLSPAESSQDSTADSSRASLASDSSLPNEPSARHAVQSRNEAVVSDMASQSIRIFQS